MGYYNKNTINWVAYKHVRFILIMLEIEKSKVMVLTDLVSFESLLPHKAVFLLCPHMAERSREFYEVSFIRILIPSVRGPL